MRHEKAGIGIEVALLSGTLLQGLREIGEARRLIESQGLRFEESFDKIAGLYDNGQLVACGARAGYVLKMIAIEPSYQGTDALGEVVTMLIRSGIEEGFETFFVFTRPETSSSFQALNFRLLAAHGTAALLEHGPGIEDYFAKHTRGNHERSGAVVINGNPFSLGHLHLVEEASRQAEHLYLFVVREDRSVFPFSVRYRLAAEATAHLRNVSLLDTSRYAVSAGTFPSYFLKQLDEHAAAQMQIDLRIFAEVIAERFRITRRFVGQEPNCETTAAYNRTMKEVLQERGIEVVEIPRVEAMGEAISATRVRRAFALRDFETLRHLVPAPTLEYLRSASAYPIAERLRSETKGG